MIKGDGERVTLPDEHPDGVSYAVVGKGVRDTVMDPEGEPVEV